MARDVRLGAPVWPSQYDGDYLYGDFVCGKIVRLESSGTGSYSPIDFATGLGSSSAVHMRFGPWNGPFGSTQALYYTTYASGGECGGSATPPGCRRSRSCPGRLRRRHPGAAAPRLHPDRHRRRRLRRRPFESPRSGTTRYWRRGRHIWGNTRDRATLRAATGALVDVCACANARAAFRRC